MPYDSQGVFTRVMNWQEDAANSVPIVASRHDDEDDNFAQGFNEVLCRDGRAAMTGSLKMGANKITNMANGTTNNDAVNYGQLSAAQNTLQENIDTKANNDAVVKLSGNQTIADVKTFTSSPILPTPAKSDNSTKAATAAFVKNQNYTPCPNYAAASDLTKANGTVANDGWLLITPKAAQTTFSINGMGIVFNGAYNIYTAVPTLLPVKAGDTYTSTSWNLEQFKFIPNR